MCMYTIPGSKGSLGVFKVIESKQLKAFIKLHNFRYDCTRSYLSSKHLGSNTYCQGCGMNKRKGQILQ